MLIMLRAYMQRLMGASIHHLESYLMPDMPMRAMLCRGVPFDGAGAAHTDARGGGLGGRGGSEVCAAQSAQATARRHQPGSVYLPVEGEQLYLLPLSDIGTLLFLGIPLPSLLLVCTSVHGGPAMLQARQPTVLTWT